MSPADSHPSAMTDFAADAWIVKRNAGWGEVSRESGNQLILPE
jgi:hypothetical protein